MLKSTAEALHAFEAAVDRYLIELEGLEMEQLLRKASEEEWSVGQMYVHLIQSAQFMHLQHVDQCVAGSEAALAATGYKTEICRTVFELGSFPPVRVRVPASPQYTPQQPESKEQLIEGLRGVVERMKRTEPALSEAPEQNRIPHRRFGPLNAKEWFLLIEMHYRHHFLQLDRLKSELSLV